jgi:hypothetical protein
MILHHSAGELLHGAGLRLAFGQAAEIHLGSAAGCDQPHK